MIDLLLAEKAAEFEVPGASIAVFDDGQWHTAETGICSVETQTPVVQGTVFAIGSLAKLFTATIVAKLSEKGKVGLDHPISEYLGDELSGASWAGEVTVRMLLAHTSGIDGDFFFADTGRGEDALTRYCQKCSDLPLLFSPGQHTSYCNAGYALLGRLIEHIAGKSWEDVTTAEVIIPLQLERTGVYPESAMTRPLAVGHFPARGPNRWRQADSWEYLRSLASSGTAMTSTAKDIAVFGAQHLLGEHGFLSEDCQVLMQSTQPVDDQRTEPRGLGWELTRDETLPCYEMLSHDGAIGGNVSALRVFPKEKLVVAILTNWARAPLFNSEMVRSVVSELRSEPLTQATLPVEHVPLSMEGALQYQSIGVEHQISAARDGEVSITSTSQGRTKSWPIRMSESNRGIVEDGIFGQLPIYLDDELLSMRGHVYVRS